MAKHAKQNRELYFLEFLDEFLKLVLFPIFVSSIIYFIFNGNSEVEKTIWLKVLLGYFELLIQLFRESYEVFKIFFLIICVTLFALELIDKTLVRKNCVVTISNVFRNMIKIINILSFFTIVFYMFILYLVSIDVNVIGEEAITIIPLYYALLVYIYDILKKLIKSFWCI